MDRPPDFAALPVLRFSPTAWAKLRFFCHAGDTEIGGFGISRPDDLLCIEDFLTVRQKTTSVTVAFDDSAVADFYDQQVDRGLNPAQFSRVWLHSHPGTSATPSSVDEETFSRCFGGCDWAVMAILARGGQTYARLRFNTGPGGHLVIPTQVDYSLPFAGSDHPAWQAEYNAHVHPGPCALLGALSSFTARRRGRSDRWPEAWDTTDLIDAFAAEHFADDLPV